MNSTKDMFCDSWKKYVKKMAQALVYRGAVKSSERKEDTQTRREKMDANDLKEIAKTVAAHLETKRLAEIAAEVHNKGQLLVRASQHVYNETKKCGLVGPLDIRLLCLFSVCSEIKRRNVMGSVAELGVFRGGFAKYIHILLPDRDFYLFDTFNGFDQDQFAEEQQRFSAMYSNSKGFSDTSVDIVLKTIGGNRSLLHPIPGMFPTSLISANIDKNKYCFVSIDADLYQPTKDGLEYFYPRLVEGGAIMIHDFICRAFPGVQKAVLEFVRKNHLSYVIFPDVSSTCCISKPLA